MCSHGENPARLSSPTTIQLNPLIGGSRMYQVLVYLYLTKRTLFAVSFLFATPTGLEPATSAVTGRRSNQLSYRALFVFPYK